MLTLKLELIFSLSGVIFSLFALNTKTFAQLHSETLRLRLSCTMDDIIFSPLTSILERVQKRPVGIQFSCHVGIGNRRFVCNSSSDKLNESVIKGYNSMNHICSINSLPEEILIEIFEYLTHNELGRISRVCRKWYTTAKNPVLWRKVNIKFRWFNGSQRDIVSKFSEKLCSSVTYIKLVFDYCHWKERLDFLEVCVSLKEKCPLLNTLILHCALFTNSFSLVIDACSEFLPNLKALLLPKSVFCDDCKEKEFGGPVNIEILDISACSNIRRSSVRSFSKMLSLKKLNLFGTFETDDRCFWHEANVSFLHQLEILHVGNSSMCSRTFRLLQKFAINLKELFLCWSDLDDEDFNFSNSVFPLLKIVCLRRCKNLSYDGITSLLQSCVPLEVIYIDRDMCESSVIPSLPFANISELGIVKVVC